MPNNEGLGLGSSCLRLKEETTSAASCVLVVMTCLSALVFDSGAAAGAWELLMELWLAGVVVGVMMVVALEFVVAELSTSSTSCEMGGESGLRVGEEAAGGSGVVREGSKLSEEWNGVSIV